MPGLSDSELLQDYVKNGSDEAFAQIVERHTDMVYAFCFRQMRNRELAEDAAQTVFIILSKKAASLKRETVLPGWLFKTARFAIANALKIEARKRRIQTRAQAMAQTAHSSATLRAVNDDAFALLDDALGRLPEFERNAVLLKYFEQRTLAEVGAALGVSADAAEKRVTRAIGKLHAFFAQRGVVLSIAGMGSLLAASASQMAPSGFSASVTKTLAVKSARAAAPGSHALTDATLRAMEWARWKPAFAVGCLVLVTTAAVFVAHAGVRFDFPNPTVVVLTPPGTPAPSQPQSNANKINDELRRLFSRITRSQPADRDVPEREVETFVRQTGQPAFAQFANFITTPEVTSDADVAARAARIIRRLTEPAFLWGQTTGATLSHPPRPAASAAIVAQSTDDGLFVLETEAGAIQWSKPLLSAPSVGHISGTTVFSAVPFSRANPHATLAAFGTDGATAWTHSFDPLYPAGAIAQIRTSLAFDTLTNRVFITAGADEKESLSAFTLAGDPIWSAHCGTLTGDPVLALDVNDAIVACENSNGADAELRAVHLADGAPNWVAAFSGLHRNCIAEANGRVYAAVSADGQEAAFSTATHIASRNAADGAGVWDCDVNTALPALPARATLEYLMQSKFGEHSWHETGGSDRDIVGVPIVGLRDQRVVSQTKRFLFGIDVATGKLTWSTPCLRVAETHFAARNGIVFAGTDDGLLLAVRALDGSVVWTLDLNTYPAAQQAPHVFEIRDNDFPNGRNRIGPIGEPTVLDDVLYATTAGGWTFALKLPAFEPISGSPGK